MSSVAASLSIVQEIIIRYGFPVILALGNLGNLVSIIVFSQKHHRQNPCSFYLLSSAVIGLIGLNWGFGTNLNAIYQSPDPFTVSLVLCKTRGYILQITSVIYRTMIVLACIDRFAVSSIRVKIRAFSKPKIAMKLIGGTTLFWMIATIHQPIFQTIQNNRCVISGTYGLVFSIYQICLFGVISPGFMVIFGILLLKNLKKVRARVQPGLESNYLQQSTLNKRDINLIKIVLSEAIAAILLTFFYTISTLETVLTLNIANKSIEIVQIEVFMGFLTRILLFYLNFCVNFYLYIIMSKSFRQEVKRIILTCFGRPIPV